MLKKLTWLNKVKKIGINEGIKRNEIINNSLKTWIWYLHIKMEIYCLKCKKDTENINPRVSKTSNNSTMILSKCAEFESRKARFIKNQEAILK